VPHLIAAFDDAGSLETAVARLADSSLSVRTRVIEQLGQRDEQPLPPEIGGGSQVPVATPTAATGHDVAPGDEQPHPEGMQAAIFADVLRAIGGDSEAADHYRHIVAQGGAVLTVEGDPDELESAERLLRASRPIDMVRFR
jgi:hypothetical protein